MELTDIQRKFVLHWGEMGSMWGVNRTVSQIHALLFAHGKPMHAEELSETLGVARSNVSNSLKELQSWGLVRITHMAPGQFALFPHFRSDGWIMFEVRDANTKQVYVVASDAAIRASD